MLSFRPLHLIGTIYCNYDYLKIQRIYYEIKKLEITCPEDFDYDDLDKDAYTQAVFEGQGFLEAVSPRDANCDGDDETVCLFSGARAAEWSSFNECPAKLYINLTFPCT